MAQFFEITPTKTYATKANAVKAVEKKDIQDSIGGKLIRYTVIQNEEGRWYPIFIGEQAVQAGVHFLGFNIVG